MTLTKIEPFLPTNLARTGIGLNRPECVLAARDGSLYTGDWTLGIARIAPDGTTGPAVEADLIAQGFRPNGIALTADGDFLFANLSKKAGGVWRVGRRGEVRPFATEVAGRPIPPTNFVLVDGDRVWITISASTGKHTHFTAEENTGQILLVQDGNVTVAADGLNWTNELRISPDGSFSSAMPPSFETNCACAPAERAICPPLPGFSSILCTTVPAGMFWRSSELPTRMSASGPDVTLRPTSRPTGAKM